MGTNFLQRGMRYSLLAVMFFITFAMAQAQPGGGGNPTDSTGMRMMNFNMQVNHLFDQNYRFLSESLLWDSSSISVNYQLSYASPISSEQFLQPTGMTITDGGRVRWTPTVAGRYYFAVTASTVNGLPQSVTVGNIVTVTPGETPRCATIIGQITTPAGMDSLGYRPEIRIMAIPVPTSTSALVYNGVITSAGTYRIRVPQGQYKIALQFMNTTKYYNNATTLETAQTLTLACNDTLVANMSITTQDIPNRVYFTSVPTGYELNSGQIGTYDVNAASTQGSVVRYRLFNSYVEVDTNVRATINEQTGVTTFSATNRGQHFFVVEAFIPGGDSLARDYQEIHFFVRGNQTPVDTLCAKIFGTITNSTPVNDSSNYRIRGMVYALPLGIADSSEWGYGGAIRTYQAEIKLNGTYVIKVPAGSYKILFNAEGFVEEFYNNAQDYATAETVTVVCGDSLRINADLTPRPVQNRVYFTTEPRGYELNPNEVGTYDANAVASNGSAVRYRYIPSNNILDSNITVSINPVTGVATFSSPVRGEHFVGIEAFVEGDSLASAFQSLRFWVRGNQIPVDSTICATIYGTVTNNLIVNDSTISRMRGSVYAFPLNSDSNNAAGGRGMRTFQAEIRANGTYFMRVPAGSYKLLFEAQGFDYEFYNNAQNYDSAQTVTVACGDSLVINAELAAYVPPTMFTLSGRVFNETNNEGIRAIIRLFLNDNLADSTESTNPRRAITIENRQDGTYSIQLPEGTSFKAFAVPMNQNLYLGEYYNNTYNVEEAELIAMTANRSGVDFGLTRRTEDSTSRFNISGRVSDDNNDSVLAMVTLIRKPAVGGNQNEYKFYNMPTDAAGNYNFRNVKQGSYILFAMPVNKPLLPGFYVDAAPSTWNWEEATVIAIPDETSAMPTVQYNIQLRNITDAPGVGRIAGTIEQGMGKIAKFAKLSKGTGVSGVLVTAFDANLKPVKYAYTDDNGVFNFDKLGFGKFTLSASKIGMGSKATTITIDAENLDQTASLYMDVKSNDPSSVEDVLTSNVSIYPNPVQATTNLSFQANEGNATIVISDMQGREVITMYETVINGINTIAIDARELTSGLYSVKVNGENLSLQTLMNVVK